MIDGGLAFNGLDKDRDGKLVVEESPDAAAFHATDSDGDGVVTRAEFKVYWRQHGKRESKGN